VLRICGASLLISGMIWTLTASAQDLALSLRHQVESSPGSGRFHQLLRQENWKPEQTAIIVCDMWDLHHSQNAVRRESEFAPRLDQVLKELRRRGATVIHSPSDCMDSYADHPARQRAVNTPTATELPDDIQSWCYKIPPEEKGVYPIDQSDGGEDDDPVEKAKWVVRLEQLGRNPASPWKTQTDLLTIDAQRDYISDRGEEIWSILEQRGITNVILAGVHTNMCVLGRPFGLRQMARNGKHVVLMRDLTDTMYNPQRWPYVNHFTGTDLIVSHIEKFVCPTITSDQIVGGSAFRFQHDKRPHVAIVMSEDEYETNRTLPEFAVKYLGKQFRVSLIFGSDQQLHEIPGLDALDAADVAIISVRRRTLRPEQLAIVRRFVESGKPVVGIRTASHAFSQRDGATPEGHVAWPEFDAQVFGGHYTNHFGNGRASTVAKVADAAAHPILSQITSEPFAQGGSLYMTSPLAAGTTVLLTGTVEGQAAEPVAWTFQRHDGGRSFYTSMGHPKDFANVHFNRLLLNSVCWAAGMPAPENVAISPPSN
jgi:nicotinamidase-related amidase/type 1 glutamine amidotransferase